jgi:hypothetical protein
MANVIERVQRPTLVIAHNKTLAAQLCSRRWQTEWQPPSGGEPGADSICSSGTARRQVSDGRFATTVKGQSDVTNDPGSGSGRPAQAQF